MMEINDLTNDVDVYLGTKAGGTYSIETIKLTNIPIQTWVNILMTIHNKSVDLYLDGKLVVTQILQKSPYKSTESEVDIMLGGAKAPASTATSAAPTATSATTVGACSVAVGGTNPYCGFDITGGVASGSSNLVTEAKCKLANTAKPPGGGSAIAGDDNKCVWTARTAATIGFDGYISNFLYRSETVDPREAYSIYREGPGGSNWFSNFMSKYKIKLSFIDNNIEVLKLML